ncbi:odorant receptor 67c-like [Periplaneta americana]|uniref:odorant receptor 67c-like n=1 Tax=Periplaneta americana TaxID=6978 RepID=UPI0037E95335
MMLVSSQAIDSMLMVLMSLVSVKFKIIVSQLDEMNENVAEEVFGSNKDFVSNASTEEHETMIEERYRLYLIDCIQRHQKTIEFAAKLNEVVSVAGLLQMMNIPIMICSNAFHLTQNEVKLMEFFLFLSLCVMILIKLFVYCWYGQDVIDQSEKVQIALYSTDWYNKSPSYKKLVPTMLMRASHPVKLRNGIFNDLSFETFTAVLNTAYSYLALLSKMNES